MEELPMPADDKLRLNVSKKRKLNYEFETVDSAAVEFTKTEASPDASWTSGSDENDGCRKRLRSTDLKEVIVKLFDGYGTEVSISGGGIQRYGTQTSDDDVCKDSDQAISTGDASSASSPRPTPGRNIPSSASPPAKELEDFFTAAESHLQKRFAKKYNYDIVKDIPMEGRFLWVRLHP